MLKSAAKGLWNPEVPCFHCGTLCAVSGIRIEDKSFCCEGCRLVYEIINNNGLCDYYKLQSHPGLSQIKGKRLDKWAYLDSDAIAEKLYAFTNGDLSIVTLYLPGVHCSSCLWLLEHLPRVHPGIKNSRLQFDQKRLTIHFSRSVVTLRAVAELLDTLGYEPLISLHDADAPTQQEHLPRGRIIRLGVAGFCFGNIMMMSFPEYFGGEDMGRQFAYFFRYAALLLSLPVVFYCAGDFFTTAWNGLRSKTLNIDAPIALAITITFARSLYEILSGTGSGYLDSMSGIVFFMLVGRMVQERAWRSLSFHRDYKSYFPIAVQVLVDGQAQTCSLHDLKRGDVVSLYHGEIIPADALLLGGEASIDYSFVSGESEPVKVAKGSRLYAGGRQTGGAITLSVEKPVAGSYLTSLWNHNSFDTNKAKEAGEQSVVHVLAKYFTLALFGLAAITAVYWAIYDPAKIIPAVSAMLIVACPCALLLSSTFTNAAVLRALSNNGLYLRDAQVIETFGNIDHIVFDKTGTLTTGNKLSYAEGSLQMNAVDADCIIAVVQESAHPRSRLMASFLGRRLPCAVRNWQEIAGGGVKAVVEGQLVRVGSAAFVQAKEGADVYASIGGRVFAFDETPVLRIGVPGMLQKLKSRFACSMLSGDNSRHMKSMTALFGNESALHFGQQPLEKLAYVEKLQEAGHKVLMVGDGLNDAGALQQSDVGITLADDINNFTPSCDAILDAARFQQLPAMLRLARWARTAIRLAFGVSVIYNITGLYYAVQGELSPMIAAILMPASTLSIVLIGVGCTELASRRIFSQS